MPEVYSFDPHLGYVPAIPEPFWYRGWRSWFQFAPACYACGNPLLLKDRRDWEAHYALNHIAPLGEEHEADQDDDQ